MKHLRSQNPLARFHEVQQFQVLQFNIVSQKYDIVPDQNVLWTLFNGEAFDYIGSQRVAYDIRMGEWPAGAPLSVEDIRLHVEVGQIGGSLSKFDNSWNINAFVPYNFDVPEVMDFFNSQYPRIFLFILL